MAKGNAQKTSQSMDVTSEIRKSTDRHTNTLITILCTPPSNDVETHQ